MNMLITSTMYKRIYSAVVDSVCDNVVARAWVLLDIALRSSESGYKCVTNM